MKGYLLGYLLFGGIIATAFVITGIGYAGRWLLLGPLALTAEQASWVFAGFLLFVCASLFAYLVGSDG
jgi:hypothetical protein